MQGPWTLCNLVYKKLTTSVVLSESDTTALKTNSSNIIKINDTETPIKSNTIQTVTKTTQTDEEMKIISQKYDVHSNSKQSSILQLNGKINGKITKILLDSGADRNCIDKKII